MRDETREPRANLGYAYRTRGQGEGQITRQTDRQTDPTAQTELDRGHRRSPAPPRPRMALCPAGPSSTCALLRPRSAAAAPRGRCVVTALPRFAYAKGKDAPDPKAAAKNVREAKEAVKEKRLAKARESQNLPDFIKIAKLLQPQPFKIKRTPEELKYAERVAKMYSHHLQQDSRRWHRLLNRMIQCKQAAIDALPTAELQAEAAVEEFFALPPEYRGAKRLLTVTAPLPGFEELWNEYTWKQLENQVLPDIAGVSGAPEFDPDAL